MKNRYRVVADRFAGYEAQVKFWWLPVFWFQIDGCNTSGTLYRARTIIDRHKNQRVYYQE